MLSLNNYPPELIFAICAYVYSAGLPAPAPTLDPLVFEDDAVPTGLPSAVPPGNWSERASLQTLANLCLVNHTWYEAAKPWLWRKIEVRLPRSWMSILEGVAWDFSDDATIEQTALAVEKSIKAAAGAAIASTNSTGSPPRQDAALKLEESILESLSGPDSPIPLELLSPPASRDPSPRRPRAKSKSPARWKIMRSISNAVRSIMEFNDPGVYIPLPHDPRPGRFVRHLDFNHFRTIGMRRSLEEGMASRFVTGGRVHAVLKEMTNLIAFGATEYMDGALTLPVLNELFLRGTPSHGGFERGRGLTVAENNDSEDEDFERRKECKDLEAVDFTGCVSAVFVSALTEFVTAYLLPTEPRSDTETFEEHSKYRAHGDEPLVFPGLQRLGLRGVKSVLPRILTPFVLAFPSLTHLDLSGTRVTPELLVELGKSPTVRLYSLALARCTRLTSESIKNFLIGSPVASRIQELSLYGDITFPSALSEDDLRVIFSHAPCFTTGILVYLDLSSAPVTQDMLLECSRPQPTLRSLGLSYIPDLALGAIIEFLRTKASNVEVLTLASTSPELDCGMRAAVQGVPHGSPRQASAALHTQLISPLCTTPFSLNASSAVSTHTAATRLRVIELSMPLLAALSAGAGPWRVIRSKGGRGWYADTACGWVADGAEGSVLRRNIEPTHAFRVGMNRMADANGNVNSGVGWHARKMEILHGLGLLGREDGLYGAVSFAYQS